MKKNTNLESTPSGSWNKRRPKASWNPLLPFPLISLQTRFWLSALGCKNVFKNKRSCPNKEDCVSTTSGVSVGFRNQLVEGAGGWWRVNFSTDLPEGGEETLSSGARSASIFRPRNRCIWFWPGRTARPRSAAGSRRGWRSRCRGWWRPSRSRRPRCSNSGPRRSAR